MAARGAVRRNLPWGIVIQTTSLATEPSSVFTEGVPAASSPTKERLLDQAMRLFGERGYDATSVAEIERSAGLTPGAGGLFHHFRTKEEVLVAGINRQLARLEAVRQIRGAVPPLGNLRAELTLVARYVFLELEEEQELLRVLSSERRQPSHLLAGAVDQVVRGTFNEFAALLGRLGRHRGGRRARPRLPRCVRVAGTVAGSGAGRRRP